MLQSARDTGSQQFSHADANDNHNLLYYHFNKQDPRIERVINKSASFDLSPDRRAYIDENLVRSVTQSSQHASYHPKRDDRLNRSMPNSHRPKATSVVLNQAADLHLDRVVLYKRGHYVDDVNYFVIEISVT